MFGTFRRWTNSFFEKIPEQKEKIEKTVRRSQRRSWTGRPYELPYYSETKGRYVLQAPFCQSPLSHSTTRPQLQLFLCTQQLALIFLQCCTGNEHRRCGRERQGKNLFLKKLSTSVFIYRSIKGIAYNVWVPFRSRSKLNILNQTRVIFTLFFSSLALTVVKYNTVVL